MIVYNNNYIYYIILILFQGIVSLEAVKRI